MKQLKKINVRMTPAEYARLIAAARENDSSVNRFLIDAALHTTVEKAQTNALEAVVTNAISVQTETLSNALASIAELHSEQDQALRADLKSSLEKVLARVGKGATK